MGQIKVGVLSSGWCSVLKGYFSAMAFAISVGITRPKALVYYCISVS
jgi:hypothetical protein